MTAGKWPDTRLGRVLAAIERHYGSLARPPFAGPFEMILWEIMAYLADDAQTRRSLRRAAEASWAGAA
jgi:hypothetical protein